MSALLVGDDGLARCAWAGSTPDYLAYHDTEWGVPVRGEQALFERLTLEAFQSGLSWLTILRKREAFRLRSPRSTPSGWPRSTTPTGRGCWPTPRSCATA